MQFFGKIWQICMLAPRPGGLAPLLRGILDRPGGLAPLLRGILDPPLGCFNILHRFGVWSVEGRNTYLAIDVWAA